METWIQNAISNWQSHKVKMNPPATIEEIREAEYSLDIKFPQDFKQFYLTINGFQGLDWQEHMFTFWPLKMMVEEYDETEDGFVGFSDYFLKVNAIGFKKNESGIYKIYPSLKNEVAERIASTFSEVVAMINSNHDLVY